MRLIHPLRLHLIGAVVLSFAAFFLGGCDTDITLTPEIEVKHDAELDARLTELETSASEHRERADLLQAEMDRMETVREEESIVVRAQDGFTFRLNENAALVLVVLILGATVCFVSWTKHRRRDPDGFESEA